MRSLPPSPGCPSVKRTQAKASSRQTTPKHITKSLKKTTPPTREDKHMVRDHGSRNGGGRPSNTESLKTGDTPRRREHHTYLTSKKSQKKNRRHLSVLLCGGLACGGWVVVCVRGGGWGCYVICVGGLAIIFVTCRLGLGAGAGGLVGVRAARSKV